MMREILFRGKRLDNGEWIEGCYTFSKKADRHIVWVQSENNAEFWHTYPIVVDPLTVGQFTGLTDKNGKKIFEGDIIRSVDPDCPESKMDCGVGTAEFYEGLWYISGEINDGLHDIVNYSCKELEVIGNIHDKEET